MNVDLEDVYQGVEPLSPVSILSHSTPNRSWNLREYISDEDLSSLSEFDLPEIRFDMPSLSQSAVLPLPGPPPSPTFSSRSATVTYNTQPSGAGPVLLSLPADYDQQSPRTPPPVQAKRIPPPPFRTPPTCSQLKHHCNPLMAHLLRVFFFTGQRKYIW